jgi:hypothetical protein
LFRASVTVSALVVVRNEVAAAAKSSATDVVPTFEKDRILDDMLMLK